MEKNLILENKIDEISNLAVFVEEICEELGLGMELVFNLNLVLEEAVTNVIMYAYPQDEPHTLEVKAWTENNELLFAIIDSGMEFDPTQAPDADVTLSAEEREIGGLGIFLIRQIMERVEYKRSDDGKNILTMGKIIK